MDENLLKIFYVENIGNNNKNILNYFAENNIINEALNILCEKSQETLPFLIIINNTTLVDEKLKYTNYIPN